VEAVWSTDPGNGGDSGQIIVNRIKGISNTTKINFTIGSGGIWSNDKAGDTIVKC